MKFSLFDVVKVAETITAAPDIKIGSEGTIVEIYTKPHLAYDVEFCDNDGQTLNIVTMTENQIQLSG